MGSLFLHFNVTFFAQNRELICVQSANVISRWKLTSIPSTASGLSWFNLSAACIQIDGSGDTSRFMGGSRRIDSSSALGALNLNRNNTTVSNGAEDTATQTETEMNRNKIETTQLEWIVWPVALFVAVVLPILQRQRTGGAPSPGLPGPVHSGGQVGSLGLWTTQRMSQQTLHDLWNIWEESFSLPLGY